MKKKKKKRRGLWIVLIVLGVMAAGAASGFLIDAPGRREIMELPIAAVDFRGLKDGTYAGYYDGGRSRMRAAKVRVTVASGAVSDIQVLEGAMDGEGELAELSGGLTIDDLFRRVMDAQSLQVDTVTGATLTSKAHLKAVEDALSQAQKK